MVERSTPLAARATGWRSRPGVARVAAVLLGVFGLLLMLIEADDGKLDAAVVVISLLQVSAAAALVWAGRLGYWFGLVVAALIALLLAVALTRHLDVVAAVVTAVGFLPLVLLLSPAARRPPRTAGADSAAAALDRPRGWTRPFAGGWGSFALMVVAGGLSLVAGTAMALGGRGADRGVGVTLTLFSLALLLTAPMFRPGRRRGRVRLEATGLEERQERGIVVPYSRLRTALTIVASSCLALAMLGLAVFADAFADDPGESPWPPRLIGVAGALFFGLAAALGARRGWGRRWQVLLTPSAVVVAAGGARTVVPWEAIQQVRATEVTTYVRGVPIREPFIGIDVSDPEAIQTGALERLLLPLNRRLAADISLPIRTLAIDPPLLYRALRYYHQHPRARAELATQAGLARIRHGQFAATER